MSDRTLTSGPGDQRSSDWLKIYNSLQTVAWTVACFLTIRSLVTSTSTWAKAGLTVQVCQVAALLEVVHAATGIVRGSPLTAFIQWFGRANVLFGLLRNIPEVQSDAGVGLTFLAWSLAEVVRYPWYLTTLTGGHSPMLTWLRYSCFIPLYPMGIVGEALITVHALPYIKQRRLHSFSLPNAANFAFDYHLFCLVGVSTIMPMAFLFLYIHMLNQRRARLRPARLESKPRQD